MRKKSVSHLADTIFWYSLYMLPLIIFIFCNLSALKNVNFEVISNGAFRIPYTFDYVMETFLGFDIAFNPVFSALNMIFADDGLFPTFNLYGVIEYASYFVSVFLIHLMVDFILFIPRLAHKWMKAFTEGDD